MAILSSTPASSKLIKGCCLDRTVPEGEIHCRRSRENALRHFEGVSTLKVESKGHLDLVTAADRQVEALNSESVRR
jgi:fructose-1,6-bisphosphatase/inositol monophosphatase family enzyme